MIAETQITSVPGGGLTVFTAFCVAVVVPLFTAWLRDRREREQNTSTITHLQNLSETNLKLLDAQNKNNMLLAEHIAKSDTRHEQNIETMKVLCKADCWRFAHWLNPKKFPTPPPGTPIVAEEK